MPALLIGVFFADVEAGLSVGSVGSPTVVLEGGGVAEADFLGLVFDALHADEPDDLLLLDGGADGVVLVEMQQPASHIIAL
jgi:hypothetical protein